MRRLAMWAGALLCAATCIAGDTPKLAKIVKVLHEAQPQKRDSALARDIGPNDVGKFKELRKDFAPKPDGEYLTVIWQNHARQSLTNLTVTLYYRQAHLPEVQEGKIQVSNTQRGTKYSQFEIIGEAFKKGGAVTAWKAVVSGDGKELDSFHSFLWKDPS